MYPPSLVSKNRHVSVTDVIVYTLTQLGSGPALPGKVLWKKCVWGSVPKRRNELWLRGRKGWSHVMS